MSTDPKNIVIKFLKENGYPFEMKVAREFQKKGFGIAQSVCFDDPNLNVIREIDVLALWQETFHEKKFTVLFIVECKYAKTPWILFSSLSDKFDKYYSSSSSGWRWINHLHKQNDFKHFFELTHQVGYGLTTTMLDGDKQKDNAYKAVQTILSFLKSEILKPRFSGDEYALIIPIIAIRGKLFESHLNKNDEIEAQEIHEAQLFYNEGGLGIIPKIHVVTEDVLSDYIQRLLEDTKRLFVHPFLDISIINPPVSSFF